MRPLFLIVLLAGLFGAHPVSAAGDAKAGKEASVVCASCHGVDGNKTLDNSYPKLAGQYADYTIKVLEDYRSGARSNLVMKAQAANLKDEDIRNIAAWYAEQSSDLKDLREFK